ncbi:unnamed protein product, partial [Didymodactylos carnosus]
MILSVLLSSIVILIIAIYFYIKWKYYTVHGTVPGLEPEFLSGNLRQLGVVSSNRELIDSYGYACEKMQKVYGDIFQLWIGINHYYVFCRPDHAQEIYTHRNIFDLAKIRTKTWGLISKHALVTLIGPEFKRHAKAVLPMLKKNKFIPQIPIMTNCVDKLITIWKERYENKDNIICTCIVSDSQQLMLDMFTLIAFDYDFGNLNNLLKSAKSS